MDDPIGVVVNVFHSMGDPSMISFSGGAPAGECTPIEEVREIATELLSDKEKASEILEYGELVGRSDLRQVVIDHLMPRCGIEADKDNIIILTGGQEGISLTCQLFLEEGDVVLTEDPTFFHGMGTFAMMGVECIGVEMDENGMIIEDLEKKIEQYQPKMVYTIPTFQNPTGRTMAADRRKRLAELASEHDFIVFEDDPYREMRYSGEEVPAIKSFDKTGNVVFGGTFSKIFSPGFRLGYIVASHELQKKYEQMLVAINTHTSNLSQAVCAEYFNRGYYPAHRQQLCDLHKQRRDACIESIKRYFPEEATYTVPDGGMFTWIELPEHIDTRALLKEAEEREDIKVSFTAGETMFTKGGLRKNCLRLSFTDLDTAVVEEGVKRLGKLIAEKL